MVVIRVEKLDGCWYGLPMRKNFFVLAFSIAVLAASACGGGSEAEVGADSPVDDAEGSAVFGSLVVESDRLLTFDDFKAAGVKHGKDYNIEGLPGAVGASLGFFNTKDIEIRFFPSHEIAVDQGISVVREVVGSDVLIKRENVTWTWPIADEKACAARVPGGGRDCTRSPKYGDFVVYANVIMLCEAANPEEGKALCKAILDDLPGG